jgi:hypothetical protein
MKYTQAQEVVEILRRHNIPARILTYGNPKTWDGFKVDTMGGRFIDLIDVINRLRLSIFEFENAMADVTEFQHAENEVQS